MTKIGAKRSSYDNNLHDVQRGNERWWTDHTMSYDWNEKIQTERYTKEWFDEIDKRFT
jgi:hypothetical protein